MRETIRRFLRHHGEKLALVGYLGVTLAVTPILARLFDAAWENGHVLPSLMDLRLLVGVSQDVVNIAFLGLVVSLLLLLTFDPKKRVQALLLWVGFGVTLFVLHGNGTFVPAIEEVEYLLLLVPGLVVGLAYGGASQVLRLRPTGPIEFRRAASGIYGLVVALVVVSLIEAHVVYPEVFRVSADGIQVLTFDGGVSVVADGIGPHVIAGGVAIASVKRFIQYDADEEFFVLGPPASGKSLLLIGAYLEALGRNPGKGDPLDPTQDLMELVENLDRDDSEWIVEATGRSELKELGFQFVHGSVFPKNVRIESIDYAGEHLSRLPDSLSGDLEPTDEELQRLTEGIQQADTLIMLVDLERFVNNEGLGLAEYFSILEAVEDTGALLVATKADILADEFWEEEGLEPHESSDEFKGYVEDRLHESEQFTSLVRQQPGIDVHPVYYETELNEEDERVPVREDDGSVVTVGFDGLLDRLGR